MTAAALLQSSKEGKPGTTTDVAADPVTVNTQDMMTSENMLVNLFSDTEILSGIFFHVCFEPNVALFSVEELTFENDCERITFFSDRKVNAGCFRSHVNLPFR